MASAPQARYGPAQGRASELLVSRFPPETYESDLWDLFEAAGEVQSVALNFSWAVVRMRGPSAAQRAIAELDGRPFRGSRLSVRPFRPFKIFVGAVSDQCTSGDIRVLFEDFGPVLECDIVKDYAFVHMENEEDARAAIENLDGLELKGRRIIVQPSRTKTWFYSGEEEDGAGNNHTPASSYRSHPSESFGMDYRPQPRTGHPAMYKDQHSALHGNHSYTSQSSFLSRDQRTASHTPYGVNTASSRDSFYEAQPSPPSASFLDFYEDELAFDAQSFGPSGQPHSASYDIHPAVGPSYGATAGGQISFHKAQLSNSLSMRDRAPVDASDAVLHSGKVPGYRNQLAHDGLIHDAPQTVSPLGMSQPETGALDIPYVRVRLSPPRGAYNDRRRENNAAHKLYPSKPETAAPRQPYKHLRLSPPQIDRENSYRESGAVKRRYAADSDAAAPHQPYERIRLSPPRSNRDTLKVAMVNKRYSSSYR